MAVEQFALPESSLPENTPLPGLNSLDALSRRLMGEGGR
jgi:hypothetical protein